MGAIFLLLLALLSPARPFSTTYRAYSLSLSRPFAATSVSCASSLRSSSPTRLFSETRDAPLPDGLERLVAGFERMGDEKIRYQQLLFLATKLPAMDESLKTDANKVPGCLSTVHVSASLDGSGEGVLFEGDSDGMLTKGLVAMLVTGLSGCTAEEIQGIDGTFITRSGLDQSLTPGRNNGFLNMIATMKEKALEVSDEGDAPSAPSAPSTPSSPSKTPMYDEIMAKLALLKPTSIDLEDQSDQHAGHGGAKGWAESGESHFKLVVVCEVFEGMSTLKKHQLIYTILGDTMDKIHALSIEAKAPSQL